MAAVASSAVVPAVGAAQPVIVVRDDDTDSILIFGGKIVVGILLVLFVSALIYKCVEVDRLTVENMEKEEKLQAMIAVGVDCADACLSSAPSNSSSSASTTASTSSPAASTSSSTKPASSSAGSTSDGSTAKKTAVLQTTMRLGDMYGGKPAPGAGKRTYINQEGSLVSVVDGQQIVLPLNNSASSSRVANTNIAETVAAQRKAHPLRSRQLDTAGGVHSLPRQMTDAELAKNPTYQQMILKGGKTQMSMMDMYEAQRGALRPHFIEDEISADRCPINASTPAKAVLDLLSIKKNVEANRHRVPQEMLDKYDWNNLQNITEEQLNKMYDQAIAQ